MERSPSSAFNLGHGLRGELHLGHRRVVVLPIVAVFFFSSVHLTGVRHDPNATSAAIVIRGLSTARRNFRIGLPSFRFGELIVPVDPRWQAL
jgi:hypothetical protein